EPAPSATRSARSTRGITRSVRRARTLAPPARKPATRSSETEKRNLEQMADRKTFLLTLGLGALLTLSSCAPPARGAFTASGFQNRTYDYGVVALPDGQVLPSS